MDKTVELAIEATVATLAVIFAFFWFINQFTKKKNCLICGDPSHDDFCCEAHELLFFDEEELSREESMDVDEGVESRELYREEMKMKSGLFKEEK